MERKKFKFNLFDSAIACVVFAALLLGLCHVVLHWNDKSAEEETGPTAAMVPITYQIRYSNVPPGGEAYLCRDSVLEETGKGRNIGHIVSTRIEPSWRYVVNQAEHRYERVEVPNSYTVTAEVATVGSYTDEAILISDDYELRVGSPVYSRAGTGIMCAGTVIDISRPGEGAVS